MVMLFTKPSIPKRHKLFKIFWLNFPIFKIFAKHNSSVTRNAANNGRLVIVTFVQQWRSHAQKAQAQGCPESAANDVAWPCYTTYLQTLKITICCEPSCVSLTSLLVTRASHFKKLTSRIYESSDLISCGETSSSISVSTKK